MSVFEDRIDNYANGASGTLTTPGGASVGYTVSSNSGTRDWGDVDQGAQVQQANGFVEVSFEAPVQNAAIQISSANSGEEYVVAVNGQTVDLNTLISSGQASFHNLGGNQIVNGAGQLTASGSWTGMDTAVLQFHIPVTSLKVSGDGSGGGWDIFDIGFAGSALPCFLAGTRIATPTGEIPVELLRAGDLVLTRDRGPQPVLWAGGRSCTQAALMAFARQRPVRIAAGALGGGLPRRVLRVSRQHRVLVTLRDGTEALVPAIKLTDLPGINVEDPVGDVAYHHLLLAEHAVLSAEGLCCESLFWGERSPQLFPEACAAIGLDGAADLAGMRPARPFVTRKTDLRRLWDPGSAGSAWMVRNRGLSPARFPSMRTSTEPRGTAWSGVRPRRWVENDLHKSCPRRDQSNL